MKFWSSSLIVILFLVRIAFGATDERPPFKLTNGDAEILHGAANNVGGLLERTQAKWGELQRSYPNGSPDLKEHDLQNLRMDYLSTIETADGYVKAAQVPIVKNLLEEEQKHSAEIFFGDISNRFKHTQMAVEGMRNDKVLSLGGEIVSDLKAAQILFVSASEDKNLFFNLEVRTTPQEATIGYKHDMDPNYQVVPRTSNRTIEHLERARTHIQVKLKGFKDQNGDYDPATESSGVISLDFRGSESKD